MSSVRTHIPFATPQNVYQFQWPGLAEGYRTGQIGGGAAGNQPRAPIGAGLYVLLAASIYSAATLMRKQSTGVRLVKAGVIAYTAKAYLDRARVAKAESGEPDSFLATVLGPSGSAGAQPSPFAPLKAASMGPKYKGEVRRLIPQKLGQA